MLNSLVFAEAPTQAAAASVSNMPQIFLLIGFGLIVYALVLRPQVKRTGERQALLSLLAKGDIIYTKGGVVGKIARLDDAFLSIEIANGIKICIQKDAVVNTVPKGSLKGILDCV